MRAVLERQGASRYEQAMHEVWSVLAGTQPDDPCGEGGGYPPIPVGERARPWPPGGGGR